jgi:hypothetical protein
MDDKEDKNKDYVYLISEDQNCLCHESPEHYIYKNVEDAVKKFRNLYDKYDSCYKKISCIHYFEGIPQNFHYTCFYGKKHAIYLNKHDLL